jgi:hypothetical protein
VADLNDVEAVNDLVVDASTVLDWCAGSDARLTDENEEMRQVLPDALRASYGAAVNQLTETHVALMLATLRGENPDFPIERVLRVLAAAGWDGAMRDFKLQVLEHSGRREVMETARRGRSGGGRIRLRIFKGFLGALNAALDSLRGLPGVGAIQELKDFLERAMT